jgi:hypothetical protein
VSCLLCCLQESEVLLPDEQKRCLKRKSVSWPCPVLPFCFQRIILPHQWDLCSSVPQTTLWCFRSPTWPRCVVGGVVWCLWALGATPPANPWYHAELCNDYCIQPAGLHAAACAHPTHRPALCQAHCGFGHPTGHTCVLGRCLRRLRTRRATQPAAYSACNSFGVDVHCTVMC